jgi:hypothetical protein
MGDPSGVMSQVLSTLGSRITAEPTAHAVMARQPSPAPLTAEAIMKSTRMSFDVRQTRGL